MIQIREIKAEDTYPIRKKELRKNMTLSEKVPGDFDENTIHLGVFDQDELSCVATFMKTKSPAFRGEQYQLRGMATEETHQRKGLGRAVLLEAEDLLSKKEVDILWCNARVSALDFYKKLGYKTVGEIFDIPQIGPHYVMYKILRK